jgi:biotin carboxyl carrier protein
MTFEVDVNGRSCSVSVERVTGSSHFRVSVDGRTHTVDAVRIGAFGLSLLVDGDEACPERSRTAISREITVTPAGRPGGLLVGLDGRTIAASVNARRTGRVAADAGGHAHGEQAVAAPMPGRVVRILVAPGDQVAARQGVVVVEAMKMENELRAPREGIVTEIAVIPGSAVETGAVLVVIG